MKTGFLAPDGSPISFAYNGVKQEEHVLLLGDESGEIEFPEVPSNATPSFFREFSSPVYLEYDYSIEDLILMMKSDSDAFNRYEAMQGLQAKR